MCYRWVWVLVDLGFVWVVCSCVIELDLFYGCDFCLGDFDGGLVLGLFWFPHFVGRLCFWVFTDVGLVNLVF